MSSYSFVHIFLNRNVLYDFLDEINFAFDGLYKWNMYNIATYSLLWHIITVNVYDVSICLNIWNQNQVQDKQAITQSN